MDNVCTVPDLVCANTLVFENIIYVSPRLGASIPYETWYKIIYNICFGSQQSYKLLSFEDITSSFGKPSVLLVKSMYSPFF